MAHPAPGRAVSANVGEAAVVISVRRTEGHLLNGLVHDEAFCLVVHNAEAVPMDIEHGANGLALGILKEVKQHVNIWNTNKCVLHFSYL